MVLAIVGLHPSASHLLQAQQLHHGVRGRDPAIQDLRDEVFLEVAVDALSLGREFAAVRYVGLGWEVEHVLRHAVSNRSHQRFQFVQALEAGDLLALKSTHDGVLLAESRERRAKDGLVQESELGVDIERAVRHRRAGEREARPGMRSEPLERQACFAAGGLQAVAIVDEQSTGEVVPGCCFEVVDESAC